MPSSYLSSQKPYIIDNITANIKKKLNQKPEFWLKKATESFFSIVLEFYHVWAFWGDGRILKYKMKAVQKVEFISTL